MGVFSAITGAIGGFLTGGPAGAIAGGVAGLFKDSKSKGPTVQRAPGARPFPVRGSTFNQPLSSAVMTGGIPAGRTITVPEGSELTALQIIQSATGRRVPAARVLEVARVCGIDSAAALLRVDPQVICQVVLERRRRRSRGISAADLRRTTSTIRKINTMSARLSQLCGPVRRRAPRRRSA